MPARRKSWNCAATGCTFTYDGTYNDITPGFVSVPGFVNRVDIRETVQDGRLPVSSEERMGCGLGPVGLCPRMTLTTRDCGWTRTIFPYLSIQGRGQTMIVLKPYEETSRTAASAGFLLTTDMRSICSADVPGQSGLSRAHERSDSFRPGYFKKATLGASYYWGDGTNFVASPLSVCGDADSVQSAVSGARGYCKRAR